MDLSIIIVNWNSSAYLEKCLDSVYANTLGLSFEVIVVDNASFDGCGEMLAQGFPDVKFIQSQVNMGFAGANNLGFTESSGDALLFLNPDTEVVGCALQSMLNVLRRTRNAGVIGARLLNSNGTVQTSCIQRFPTVWNRAIDANVLRSAFPMLQFWGMRPLYERQSGHVTVEVVSGACMMIRRDAFEQVGHFNTEYFMYSEDVDLCFNACQHGFSNYYVAHASVVHHGGASTNGKSHYSAVATRDSLLKFFRLHRGRLYAGAYRLSVVLMSVGRCIILMCSILLASSGNASPRRNALSMWIAVLKWGLGLRAVTEVPASKPFWA